MHPILEDKSRLLAYLATWFSGSVLFAFILAATALLPPVAAVAFALPLGLVFGFVCLGAHWVCLAAPARTTHLGAAALSSMAWVLAAKAWAHALDRPGLFPGLVSFQRDTAPYLLGVGVLVFLIAAFLHYLIGAIDASRNAETEALRLDVASREAELRALRAQVHPHFLFNSLNSINALIATKPDEARRACVLLAEFLRTTLTLGGKDRVTIAEEVGLAERLLSLERIRFGERLGVTISVEEGVRPFFVLPLVLLPLVENAVTHGIAHMLEPGAVEVTAKREGAHIRLTVANPRDSDAPASRGTGLGLQNVRRRLLAAYRNEATMEVASSPTSFTVTVKVPAESPLPA
jgi:two-component system sensor histidine kinase AlgZ